MEASPGSVAISIAPIRSSVPVLHEQLSASDSDSSDEALARKTGTVEPNRQSNVENVQSIGKSNNLAVTAKAPSDADQVLNIDVEGSAQRDEENPIQKVSTHVQRLETLSFDSQLVFDASVSTGGVERLSPAIESFESQRQESFNASQTWSPSRRVPYAWMWPKVGQQTRRKMGELRNSYFARWLVAYSILVVLLNTLAILLVHFTYPTTTNETSDTTTTRACTQWLHLVIQMHFLGLPNILLVAPVLFPHDMFLLYTTKARRMIRRPYLLVCELIVAYQLGFMMYVALTQVFNVPVIVKCHTALAPRHLLLFYSATVVWLALFRQIVVFCRFLTHLKLQSDSSNDSSHTSALGPWFQPLRSLALCTRRRQDTRRVQEFRKLLYRAVACEDVDAVTLLLADAQSKYHVGPLQALYKPPVLWLYAVAKSKKNPLHIAVQRGNRKIVELLLAHGLDVNALDKVERVNFNVGLVFHIISRVLVRTQDGLPSPLQSLLCSVLLPPLHGAVAAGYVDIVRLLLSNGAHVNAVPRASFYYPRAMLPPIFVTDDPQVLRLLVAHGANFLQVASVSLAGLVRTYATPLQQSTFTLRSDLTDYLLECGGDVALTPLHQAAATDNVKQIKRLLARGIHVDTLGERVDGVHRRTPLHWAAVVGKVSAATLLLAKGANPNAKDRDGRTPLHWAARNNHIQVVSLLLTFHAQPDAIDDEGIPVVCFAAEAEGVDASIFSNLVAAGANLRTQVSGGNTALHIALQRENRKTALSLIKCGSSMMMTNDAGKRAVDCTSSTELQFLLKKEAGTRKIMISYTHTHAQLATRVREHLESQEQLTCWMDTMDPSGIGGGAVWRQEIARGIKNCSLVLSIVCDGYTKSEWCLKELALAKLLRKPVLGLIVEEDHPAAMAPLESLIPYRNRIPFNDFIVAKRYENPRTVVFEIDEAAFTKRWEVTRPLLISIIKDGRHFEHDEYESLGWFRRKRRQQKRNPSDDTVDEEKIAPLLIYSPLGDASLLRVRIQTDLEACGVDCRVLDENSLVEQLQSCVGIVLLVEVPPLLGEKGSDEAKASKIVRRQLVASMTRIVTAAQTVNPRKKVYPVLVQDNFIDLSKLYTLARSNLFYFVENGGWSRSITRLIAHLRRKQERTSYAGGLTFVS